MLSREIFSRNLRDLMARDRLNQVDLARALGVTKAAVNYWVNGRSIPQVTVVQKLADLFCCSTDDLLKERTNDILISSAEERLLSVFRSLSADGQRYLLQQAHIASQMFGKKNSSTQDEHIG